MTIVYKMRCGTLVFDNLNVFCKCFNLHGTFLHLPLFHENILTFNRQDYAFKDIFVT